MTKENEQAFSHSDLGMHGTIGLTKREYFAAAALTGMLTSNERNGVLHAATWAVKLADALIAELAKEPRHE